MADKTQNQIVSLAPRNLAEAMDFAKMLSESSVVPKDYKGKPGDIIAAIQMGAEVGLAPMQALQNISVINGRPSLWGDAMLALVKASGLLEKFDETLVNNVATCTSTRKGGHVVTSKFTMDQARRAGLVNKDNWKNYPERMLQMRARGFNLRDNFPDVLKGLVSREEAEDYDVDITPQSEKADVTVHPQIDHPVDMEGNGAPQPGLPTGQVGTPGLQPQIRNPEVMPDEDPADRPVNNDEIRELMKFGDEHGVPPRRQRAILKERFDVDDLAKLRAGYIGMFKACIEAAGNG